MKRMAIGALLCTFALSTAVNVAQAAPKKKTQKAAQAAPSSAEISKSMGELKWGMDREALIKQFTDEVREKYKPLMAKATGAIEEDKLRGQMRNELGKIRSSVVEFNGTKTGWDASFLKSEFTHHNGESMFAVNDANSQNYYFFFNNKLWKWYKAFNAEAFQGKKFDQFAGALQSRYGKAASREGELSPGQGKQRWLEWQDGGSRLRAVDNNQFYGFYCLVFEDKKTLTQLADLRKNRPESQQKGHALVDSVTGGEAGPNDGNPDIIDRITGKIRHRQDAPEPAAAGRGGSKPAVSASAPPPPTDSSPTVSEDDDPLKGLL